ncbi:MAG: zf-HC2 domain-containing protein [Thermoanaerobaculia bacterium]
MDSCRDFESLIDRAQVEDLAPAERDRLLEHLESCEACSEVFDLLGRVRGEADLSGPSAEELAGVRHAVLAELGSPARPASRRRPTAAGGRWRRMALAAGLGLVLVGGGVALGLRLAAPGRAGASAAGRGALSDDRQLAAAIREAAVRNRRFEDVENSPFVYSNVAIEKAPGERLRLSFDVARHLDLELAESDPLASEILVQALVESSAIGTRIQVIGLAGEAMSPKVKRAILVAMGSDENLGVRLSAQAKLAAAGDDPEISAAMLAVLEKEPSVQMRLAAIDYLTRNHVHPEVLERAIGAGPEAGEGAVYVRAQPYLRSHGS